MKTSTLSCVNDMVSISGRTTPQPPLPFIRLLLHRQHNPGANSALFATRRQTSLCATPSSNGTSSSLANGDTSATNGNGNGHGNGHSTRKWKSLTNGRLNGGDNSIVAGNEFLSVPESLSQPSGASLEQPVESSSGAEGNPQEVVEYLKTLGLSEDTVDWAKKHVPALFELELSSLEEIPKEMGNDLDDDLNPVPSSEPTPPPQAVEPPSVPESLKRLRPRFSAPTPSRMNHFSRRKHRQFAPSPRAGEVCNYLRSLGLHDDHIRWIQLLVPELFELEVERELRANWVRLFDHGIAPRSVIRQLRCVVVLEFLTSLGISIADCVIIAQSHPKAFCSSLEEVVEPLVVTLSKLGIPKIEIGQVLARCPELLGLNLEKQVWPVVDCLHEHTKDKMAVAKLVHSYPGIFTHSREVIILNILRKIRLLAGIGVEETYVYALLGRVPKFFTCPVDDLEAAKMLLQELGFTESQVKDFLPGFQSIAKA